MDVALLYRTHHEALYRYLSRFCGDPDMAGDAVQEAFLRIQSRPPVADANLKAWLFTVATNVVRDEARVGAGRRALLAEGSWQLPMDDAPVDPAVLVEADERRRAVTEALARLRERERTALLMREEGFTHREIAEAIGTTTGSVGTLIARSLEKLARELNFDAEDVS